MLLLGWVQLATTDQSKLEPFVPERCFFGSPQCPGRIPAQAVSLPSNLPADTSTGWGQLPSALLGAVTDRCGPLLQAASGLGGCDPNGREAVW